MTTTRTDPKIVNSKANEQKQMPTETSDVKKNNPNSVNVKPVDPINPKEDDIKANKTS